MSEKPVGGRRFARMRTKYGKDGLTVGHSLRPYA